MNNYWPLSVQYMGTMSSWALSSLRRVALDLQSFEDGRCPQEAAEAFVLHLELVYRELLMQEQLDGHSSTITRVCSMISTAIETLERLKTGVNNRCCRAPVVQSGHVGRPRFDIPQEQMIALVENGFPSICLLPQVGNSLLISWMMLSSSASDIVAYSLLTDNWNRTILLRIVLSDTPTMSAICGPATCIHVGSECSKYVSENLSGE